MLPNTFTCLFTLGMKSCVLALFATSSMLAGIKTDTLIHQTSYFSLDDVSISGQAKLTEDEIINLSGIELGGNIFRFNLEDISSRIMGSPWVEDVLVRRELPGRLVIEIRERKPFARVLKNGKFSLTDANGYIITRIKEDEYKGLPVLGGVLIEKHGMDDPINSEIFRTGLSLLRYLKDTDIFKDPIAYLRIDSRYELILITRVKKTKIRVDTENIPKELSRLSIILNYAKREGKAIETIDLCYRNKAVVKFSPRTVTGKKT